MTSTFLNQADLITTQVIYRELLFRPYRSFLKCLLSDELDPKFILLNFNEILNFCLTDFSVVKKLNYLDFILLAILIRASSIGDTVILQTKNNNLTINFNIVNAIKIFKEIDYETLLQSTNHDKFTFFYKLPSVEEILNFTNENQIYVSFIKKVLIDNIELDFTECSKDVQTTIIEQLPIKTFIHLTQHIQQITNYFQQINFFETIYVPDQFDINFPLLPTPETIATIIRLIYNSNLEIIYNNIFGLINLGKFSGEFLDSCTPGEFFLFCKNLEIITKQKEQHNTPQSTNIETSTDYS